jgi:hypothetical protein
MSTIRNIISEAFESTMVRAFVALGALGGLPVYFLSLIKVSL